MIVFKNVTFGFGDAPVMENLSFSVENGQCVALVGPSGCGKSTALRLAAGLLTPDSGEITVDGTVSVVFQNDRLLGWMDIIGNVCFPLKTADREKAAALLNETGLGDLAFEKPHNLSGGMKRRAALVRAVLYGGDALLLDEPFNGMDMENKKKAAEIIKREYLSKGKPVLLISHLDEDIALLDAKKYWI